MRTTKETRERLEAAASANGRSLAQEVEVRLERSFTEDRAFGGDPEMQRLAYRMITAFQMEGQFGADGNPDWLRDRDRYRAGLIAVLDALLIGMPGATPEDVVLVIESLKGRMMTRLVREQNK